jgi:hypothetical protein
VLRRPLPLLPPPPTTVAKARVRARRRGKTRTMALTVLATTMTTAAGAPQCGPPSIIPRPAPSRCGQGCVLRSHNWRIHRSTPCLLHRCTTVLPVAPPSRPCRLLLLTSSRSRPLAVCPRRTHGNNNHWRTPSGPWP